MTPPKKLPAPKAQNVDVKINTRGTKRAKLDRREKARQDADQLTATTAERGRKFDERMEKLQNGFDARMAKLNERWLAAQKRLAARVSKLVRIAETDPAVAKQEKARAAAAKRMEKLQAKVAELQKVIDGGKGDAS